MPNEKPANLAINQLWPSAVHSFRKEQTVYFSFDVADKEEKATTWDYGTHSTDLSLLGSRIDESFGNLRPGSRKTNEDLRKS
jgi:hypothetical protein